MRNGSPVLRGVRSFRIFSDRNDFVLVCNSWSTGRTDGQKDSLIEMWFQTLAWQTELLIQRRVNTHLKKITSITDGYDAWTHQRNCLVVSEWFHLVCSFCHTNAVLNLSMIYWTDTLIELYGHISDGLKKKNRACLHRF